MTVTVEKDGLLAYEQYLLEQQIAGLGDIPGASATSKYDATEAPDADNDIGEGYGVGSVWVDITNDKSYICVDATEGAAVWNEMSDAPSGLITDAHTHAKLVASDGSPDPALSADASGALTAAVSLTLASGATVTEFSTDDTLAGDSDAAVPTEQAVKAYADGKVAKATATTKGDLLVRSSTTIDRLGVGTDDYVLTADSAQTLGVKWAAAGAGSAPSGLITTEHTHAKLVASDGSPDPALSVDNDGYVTTTSKLTVGGLLDLSGASAGQIKFPSTQNASADANTLDDYEEGTWTPTLFAATTNFTSVTYHETNLGKYTKIGNVVHVSCTLYITAVTIGSAAGKVFVGGLPFGAEATRNFTGSINMSFGWTTNPHVVRLASALDSDAAYLLTLSSLGSNLNADLSPSTDVSTSTNYVSFSMTYRV